MQLQQQQQQQLPPVHAVLPSGYQPWQFDVIVADLKAN